MSSQILTRICPLPQTTPVDGCQSIVPCIFLQGQKWKDVSTTPLWLPICFCPFKYNFSCPLTLDAGNLVGQRQVSFNQRPDIFPFSFSLLLFSFFSYRLVKSQHFKVFSAMEVVPVLLWTSSFDSSVQKEKQFLQLRQLFCQSFNDSDYDGINSSSGDYDSALSILLPFSFFFFC